MPAFRMTQDAIAGAAIVLTAAQAHAGLLQNPGFEDAILEAPANNADATTGVWYAFYGDDTVTTYETSTVMPHSGSQNLVIGIDNTSETYAGVYQNLEATPGETLSLSFWGMRPGENSAGNEFRFEFYDADWNEISRAGNWTPAMSPEYTQYDLPEAVVPDDTQYVRVVMAMQSWTGPNGSIYIDDVTLVPEPASMALLSAGSLLVLGRRRRKA